jgi:hypothetical protein
MASILKVDTIQDQSGNNIINESADTITIGASGDTITIPSGATLSTASFSSTGIDDNADATAITIDSSERVGIGTASPGAKLEIQTGSDWGNIINSTYAGTQYLQQFEYNGTSIGRIRGDNSSISIESGSNLILQTVNTERMRITSAGNVGIGTTAPEVPLSVVGLDTQIHFGEASDGGGYLMSEADGQFRISGGAGFKVGGTGWRAKATEAAIIGHDSGGDIKFFNDTGLTVGNSFTPTERMRIDSSGNVGIGETSPGTLLDIKGVAGANNRITFNTTDAGINGNVLGGFVAENQTDSVGQITVRRESAVDDGYIVFETQATGGGLAERMRINSSGNVGIGTSSPSQKLDVNGTSRVAGLLQTFNTGLFTTDGALSNYSSTNGVYLNGNAAGWLRINGDGSNASCIQVNGASVGTAPNTIQFLTNSAQRMRITSTGNVGIGTTNPTGNLHVNSGTITGANTLVVESDNTVNSGSVNPVVVIRRNSTSASRLGGIYYQALNSSSAATSYALIEGQVTSSTAGAESGYLRIGVRGSGTLNDCFRLNADSTLNFMQSSGGIYLGTTTPVAANLLDDYEEGLHEATLTPSTSGSVALGGTENTLSYVKIGNLVNVQGALGVNVPSSPVGYIKISMPFTAASLLENADNSACSLFINNVNSATVGDFIGYILNGTSELRIFLGDTTYAEADSAQQLRSGTSITLNVSYRTT